MRKNVLLTVVTFLVLMEMLAVDILALDVQFLYRPFLFKTVGATFVCWLWFVVSKYLIAIIKEGEVSDTYEEKYLLFALFLYLITLPFQLYASTLHHYVNHIMENGSTLHHYVGMTQFIGPLCEFNVPFSVIVGIALVCFIKSLRKWKKSGAKFDLLLKWPFKTRIRDLSKVKIFIGIVVSVLLTLILNFNIIVKIFDQAGFRVDVFHEFNDEDERTLAGILGQYHLWPLPVGEFFHIRYAYTADDMPAKAFEFACETYDFTKCQKITYTDNRKEILKTVEEATPEEAKNIYNEFLALDVFELKSIESQTLSEYFSSIQSWNFYLIVVEVVDENRWHRIAIKPGKHNDERYWKIHDVFENHGWKVKF